MGNLVEKCLSRCQNDDINEPILRSPNDKICDIHMSIHIQNEEEEDNNTPMNSKSELKPLFINQFYSNPLEKYSISSDLSTNLKIVKLISNLSIIRLMKIIPSKENINDESKNKSFLTKAEDIQLLDHTNILKLYEVFVYNNNYYFICDNWKENNIMDKIESGEIFDEPKIKIILEQILNTIIHLHEKNIFNIGFMIDDIVYIESTTKSRKRRLLNDNENNEKEENIQLKKKIEVKISVINYLDENYELTDIKSLEYYSPEIIEQIEKNVFKKQSGNYINSTYDEWTCGIIIYYLISGEFPFKGEEKEEIFSNIKNKNIDFSSSKFNSFSDECKDLILKLLEKDNNKRIKCNECFNHPFFTGKKIIKEEVIEIKNEEKKEEEIEEMEEIDLNILLSLLTVKKPATRFHELIIAYLCLNYLDKEEEKKLKILFKFLDKEHKNVITEQNIKDAFESYEVNVTDEQMKNILEVFDYNKNNCIEYQEFLRVLCDKDTLFKDENLVSVFKAIDSDKNNYLNIEDLKRFVPNDENTKNKIESEFMEPFGMKPEDKMTYIHFSEVMKKNKLYSEVSFANFFSKPKKTKKKRKLE